MSSTVYDITFTIYVTSHNDPIYDITHILYVYDIFTLYGFTRRLITTQSLCNFTAIKCDITHIVSVSTQAMNQCYLTQCMYDITANICMP